MAVFKKLEFVAHTVFGKCDSVDWILNMDVSEEEYERLLEASKKNDDFFRAKEVRDIYARVYDEAVNRATANFLENDPEMVEDYLEDDQTIEEWQADDVYEIGVDFPSSWKNIQ